MTILELNRIAQAADDAWSALLRKEFGKRAGDVRYTPQGKGAAGSELRKAHDLFQKTVNAWQDALAAQRSSRALSVTS